MRQADLLLEKYGASSDLISSEPGRRETTTRDWVMSADQSALSALVGELARTPGSIRSDVSPRYRFDERWDELQACLELDGYRVEGRNVVAIEPAIDGAVTVADDLAVALVESGLPQAAECQRLINLSTENYVRADPDFNGCLNNARVALQTLATAIAEHVSAPNSRNYDPEKWGQVIAFLKKSDFIGPKEEDGLTGVFSLISPGSHRPIGFSEREYARLARSLAVTMIFFLVRRFNASHWAVGA
jgi:hypothetical protein